MTSVQPQYRKENWRDEELTVFEDVLSGRIDTAEKMESFYDNWADNYESDVGKSEYNIPNATASTFMRALPDAKDARIMDLCVGTGLVGEILTKAGYTNIDGLDGSSKMLDICQKKGIYKNLVHSFFTAERTPGIEDNTYDAIVISGGFCTSHLKPDCLYEAVRILKPGALLVTVMGEIYKDLLTGVDATVKELAEKGKLEIIERGRYPNYRDGLDGASFILKKL